MHWDTTTVMLPEVTTCFEYCNIIQPCSVNTAGVDPNLACVPAAFSLRLSKAIWRLCSLHSGLDGFLFLQPHWCQVECKPFTLSGQQSLYTLLRQAHSAPCTYPPAPGSFASSMQFSLGTVSSIRPHALNWLMIASSGHSEVCIMMCGSLSRLPKLTHSSQSVTEVSSPAADLGLRLTDRYDVPLAADMLAIALEMAPATAFSTFNTFPGQGGRKKIISLFPDLVICWTE